ncbi:MAG: hypothetical protein RDU25_06055 [Patescibacteria group bacterium]|nr:hypothetical protein [Patescibacteria group bacterium]
MKTRFFRYFALLVMISALSVPSFALAGVTKPDEVTAIQQKYKLEDPMGGKTVQQIVGRVIQQVLPAVGALFLIMFIYGGVLWMTAGGSGEKVKKATQTLVNAAIGMAIVVLAYILVNEVIVKLGAVIEGTPT